jgi:hypothetical protein
VLSDRVKGLETVVGSTNWPSLHVKHSKKIPKDETIDSNEHSVRSLTKRFRCCKGLESSTIP